MIIEFRTNKGAPIPIPTYTSNVWSALTAQVGQNYRNVHIKTGVLNQSGPIHRTQHLPGCPPDSQ